MGNKRYFGSLVYSFWSNDIRNVPNLTMSCLLHPSHHNSLPLSSYKLSSVTEDMGEAPLEISVRIAFTIDVALLPYIPAFVGVPPLNMASAFISKTSARRK